MTAKPTAATSRVRAEPIIPHIRPEPDDKSSSLQAGIGDATPSRLTVPQTMFINVNNRQQKVSGPGPTSPIYVRADCELRSQGTFISETSSDFIARSKAQVISCTSKKSSWLRQFFSNGRNEKSESSKPTEALQYGIVW